MRADARDEMRAQVRRDDAWVWRLGWGMMILPLAALLLLGCGKPEAESVVTPARSVKVVPITDTTAAPTIVASGRVEARDELDLSFKVGGVVASVGVDEGDRVREGQVLATLALPEIDAQVAKAAAGLEKAERDAARVA
ncbi:MAG TPA: biotin/lipoyl-binding protein, partial [Gemmatimonadales bacterium]|nr:biotin/lipoyl-binding protein [Gemmatimonadales bacterium]